jgi:hypothetical protein
MCRGEVSSFPRLKIKAFFASRPNVISGICVLLVKMRDAGQSLGAAIVKPIIMGYISARAPEFLGKFKVTLEWTR